MKIAFVNQPFDKVRPPFQSSLGIWTYEVARRLADSHEVLVYVRGGRLRFGGSRQDGVHYRFVPMVIDRRMQALIERLPDSRDSRRPHFASKWFHFAYGAAVARDLQRQRCDVVHVLNFSQFVPVIRRFNPASGIVLHMQCDWLAQVDPAMIEARLADADLVLGCSEYIAREVKKAFPRFGERCRAVYNGVDVGQFAPGDGISARAAGGSARILFVGRVSPEKGVHILLDAFKTVHEHQSGTHLDIVGPHGAPPREFIVSLSRDPKVTDLIRFYHRDYRSDLEERLPGDVAKQVSYVGDVPYAELPNRYRSADVFAFPSVWDEPFGMPNVEAMACGVPVVATRGGGIPELVEDGKTGFLVERGDAAGLAEAVLTLLKNESLRKSMGKAGRRRVMQLFTWKRVADDLLNQYSTIDRRRARAAAV